MVLHKVHFFVGNLEYSLKQDEAKSLARLCPDGKDCAFPFLAFPFLSIPFPSF